MLTVLHPFHTVTPDIHTPVKKKKVQPKPVDPQAVNIRMDTNPAYISTNGEDKIYRHEQLYIWYTY